MKVFLTGLNHRTAPVEVRERLAFPDATLPEALAELCRTPGVREAVILSTCNRVELTVTAEDDANPAPAVHDFLCRSRQLAPDFVAPHLYHYRDDQAIRHLFRVAASLDSMVVGEPQILGQLKAAYAAAKTAGALNGFLDAVLTRAFNVAKRVRSETGIGRNAVSVSYAAIILARQIFGKLDNRKVLLVGAGKMSELAARHLSRAGCSRIFVTNRTRERAEEMAALVEGEVVEYVTFKDRLPEVDIVITSSAAPSYILGKDDFRAVVAARRNRPIFVVDIAVPRNVDPATNELEAVFLYDIDDLGRAVEENLKARAKEAEQAEQLIADEVERLIERLKIREAGPVIVSLQQQLDALGQGELDRLRARLGDITPAQQEALAAYTRALLNKIAHGPITEIRRAAAQPGGDQTIALIRRLFRLDDNS